MFWGVLTDETFGTLPLRSRAFRGRGRGRLSRLPLFDVQAVGRVAADGGDGRAGGVIRGRSVALSLVQGCRAGLLPQLRITPFLLLYDQTGLNMSGEIYVEDQPDSYAFAGEHPRRTGPEFMEWVMGQMEG